MLWDVAYVVDEMKSILVERQTFNTMSCWFYCFFLPPHTNHCAYTPLTYHSPPHPLTYHSHLTLPHTTHHPHSSHIPLTTLTPPTFLAIFRFQIPSTLLVPVAEWLPLSFLPSLPPSLLPLSFLPLHCRVSYGGNSPTTPKLPQNQWVVTYSDPIVYIIKEGDFTICTGV